MASVHEPHQQQGRPSAHVCPVGRCGDPSGCRLYRQQPYQHFIATRLLPCGEIDGPLRKFTGSSEIGKATDDLTKAVHAFAHFMLIYTSGFLLLSDLQGEWLSTILHTSVPLEPSLGLFDARRVMCLFDPQGHTYVSTESVAATHTRPRTCWQTQPAAPTSHVNPPLPTSVSSTTARTTPCASPSSPNHPTHQGPALP